MFYLDFHTKYLITLFTVLQQMRKIGKIIAQKDFFGNYKSTQKYEAF
jgi:uncharacterized protein YbgA (DUF1722 family)